MNTKNNRPCPICFSRERINLFSQAFSGHFLHEIVKCGVCGFVFVGNTPSQAYYDRYYREESKYEGVRQHEAHETVTKEVLLQFLRSHVRKNARILDIGCSTGSLLAYIKNKGYSRVLGIDPAPGCKNVAKDKFDITVETSGIDDYVVREKFDVIILSQVLEHLVNVRTSIQKIQSFLHKDGYLFIGVPDAGRFHLKFEEPFGEFSTEHINFFTDESLGLALRGFTKVLSKSHDNALFTAWKNAHLKTDPMIEYIRKSSLKHARVERIIHTLPKKVIVWGVGALTRRLLLTTELKKKVLFFIDSSPNLIGKNIDGIIINKPDVLHTTNSPVLIASYKFREEIRKYIRKKKFTNKIFTI